MDLEGKRFLGIKNLHQQRETSAGSRCAAEQPLSVMLHQPAQVAASQRTVGDDAGVAGTVADFPRFADEFARRKGFAVEALQVAGAPDTLLETRLKRERVEKRRGLRHGAESSGARRFVELAHSAELGVAKFEPFLRLQRLHFLEVLEHGGLDGLSNRGGIGMRAAERFGHDFVHQAKLEKIAGGHL